jgi:two-component system, NarL family, sensor histidine kinase DevS
LPSSNEIVVFFGRAKIERSVVESERMGDVPDMMGAFDTGELLGEVISASPDAVIVIDAKRRVVLASPAVTELFGYSSAEIIGQSLEVLIPDGRRDRHQEHLQRYFDEPHPREMGVGLELAGRRRDGVELPIDVSLTPVRLGGELYVAAFVRDATERRRALDRLQAINEITQRLLESAPMDEILSLVAHSARVLCSSDAAWIVMPGREQFEIVSVDGKGAEQLLGVALSADTSRSAEVMRSGTPDVIEDLSSADNVPAGVVELDLGPGLYVPFVAAERRLGTLVLGRERGRSMYQPIEVAFAKVFAGAAATAIEMGTVRSELDRLSIVAEDERIARDLHDSVIQDLFALGMTLQAVGSSVSGVAGERISGVVESLDDVIRQIRNTIFRLPGQNAAVTGLREEMFRLADRYDDEVGVLPRIVFQGPVDIAVPEGVSDHLLHVFGEALSNVARHAHASNVEAVVTVEEGWLTLTLFDDGVGIPASPKAGNGIRNMITRAENLGGSCTVAPGVPSGTVVDWRVPLTA